MQRIPSLGDNLFSGSFQSQQKLLTNTVK